MSFRDLKLKHVYNSVKDDLIKDFYEPVLSEAVTYDRVVGYFNSYSLALIVDGLKDFISNEGKMRLLCGVQLDAEDVNAIENASEIANKLSNNFLEELEFLSDNEIRMNRIKLLAWMIDNDILDIKIAIVVDNEGYIGGILHEKTGILLDKNNNQLVFSGSNNETGSGISSYGKGNLEKFKVFCSWKSTEYMDDDIKEFDENWHNLNPNLEVIDIPSAAKEGLIKLAPKTKKEVMKLPLSIKDKFREKDPRELRKYQSEAISKWFDNGKNGIFKMATGSGKTFTALNTISSVLKDEPNLITIIACPYAHLCEQWADDVRSFFHKEPYIIYSSGNSKWKEDLSKLTLKLKLGVISDLIILTTHKTLSSDFFIEKICEIKSKFMLVADEMHHLSSGKFSDGLIEQYDYRLGLSATPESYNNPERTELLFDYFNGIVFTFDLDDGIGERFLTTYDYFPKKISLTSGELNRYIELSNEISRLYHINKENPSNAYKQKLRERKGIINNAKEKYDCLREILNSYDDLDHLIVFCSPQQRDRVLDILEDEGVSPKHKFTYEEGTKKSKEFGGLSEREFLVEKFDKGVYKALVAIKCLDEGVDIPSADKVIIMSSSNNPREYVQRRGRVLRKHDGKNFAEIYDMAVIEYDKYGEPIESITESEKVRIRDFIYSSNNPGHGINLLKKWRLML